MAKPPFYQNTQDNTHCFQAVMKMVCGYYFPMEDYSWDQLDRITKKVKGLWTWPMAGYIWLAHRGMVVESISNWNLKAFAQEGIDYIRRLVGDEVACEQEKHTNIAQGQRLAFELLKTKHIKHTVSIPSMHDLQNRLDEGQLVICNLNQMALNNKPGYSGHFVLIYAYNKDNLIMHDPGLPAHKARRVSFDDFEKAWSYPDKKARNMVAMMRSITNT